MNIRLFFGILSLIPAAIAYFFYFRGMLRGITKPHAFSWLVWCILAGNGFFVQLSAHAGIGAWATGVTSVVSFVIFICALRIGGTQPTRFDWMLLSLALLSLLMLLFINSKDVSLCITLFALITGFVMNIHKAYNKPLEENALSFWLNALKFGPAIFALSTFTFLTVAYPLVAAFGNAAVALTVNLRSRSVLNIG